MLRGENMCGLEPNCGKNLLIPNGAGLTRNDIPCLVDVANHPNGKPATIIKSDDEDQESRALLELVRQTCPAYLGNYDGEGSGDFWLEMNHQLWVMGYES